jgi:hypothetical protein
MYSRNLNKKFYLYIDLHLDDNIGLIEIYYTVLTKNDVIQLGITQINPMYRNLSFLYSFLFKNFYLFILI